MQHSLLTFPRGPDKYKEKRHLLHPSRAGLTRAGVRLWKILAYGTKPGKPGGLLAVWPKWEQLAHKLWPTMRVSNEPYGILHIRLRKYKGPPLSFPDGSVIRKNAIIAELHCDNGLLLVNVAKNGVNPYRACREDLRAIASWAQRDSLGHQIEALYGTTMLAVAAARLGFTLRESPHRFRRWLDRFFMIGLLLLYTESSLNRLTRGTTLSSDPMEIWLTRNRLLKLYSGRDRAVGIRNIQPEESRI
ncbi:MAG TPA: hypothetical protein VMF50_08565 [Candidatus Binataceae bacterium]|nr:hypothetical protein [Candidatus Binataceae bacterium]